MMRLELKAVSYLGNFGSCSFVPFYWYRFLCYFSWVAYIRNLKYFSFEKKKRNVYFVKKKLGHVICLRS